MPTPRCALRSPVRSGVLLTRAFAASAAPWAGPSELFAICRPPRRVSRGARADDRRMFLSRWAVVGCHAPAGALLPSPREEAPCTVVLISRARGLLVGNDNDMNAVTYRHHTRQATIRPPHSDRCCTTHEVQRRHAPHHLFSRRTHSTSGAGAPAAERRRAAQESILLSGVGWTSCSRLIAAFSDAGQSRLLKCRPHASERQESPAEGN